MSRIVRDGMLVCVVFGASLVLGLLSNSLRRERLPLLYQDRETRVLKAVLPGGTTAPVELETLDFQQANGAWKTSDALFVDARDSAFFEEGHIPGAVNVSREDILLAKARITSAKDRRLVVYCSGEDCEDSRAVAKGLCAMGYSNVTVYAGGWEEWSASGSPVEK